MGYTYAKVITGTQSNLDKKINEYLESTDYSNVLDIKITEITKTSSTSEFLVLLILER